MDSGKMKLHHCSNVVPIGSVRRSTVKIATTSSASQIHGVSYWRAFVNEWFDDACDRESLWLIDILLEEIAARDVLCEGFGKERI